MDIEKIPLMPKPSAKRNRVDDTSARRSGNLAVDPIANEMPYKFGVRSSMLGLI